MHILPNNFERELYGRKVMISSILFTVKILFQVLIASFKVPFCHLSRLVLKHMYELNMRIFLHTKLTIEEDNLFINYISHGRY